MYFDTPIKRLKSIENRRSANLLGIFSKNFNIAKVYNTIDLWHIYMYN